MGRASAWPWRALALPTGELDSRTSERVLDLLFGLRDQRGMTLLVVSYDSSVGARADRTLTLSDGMLSTADPLASGQA